MHVTADFTTTKRELVKLINISTKYLFCYYFLIIQIKEQNASHLLVPLIQRGTKVTYYMHLYGCKELAVL